MKLMPLFHTFSYHIKGDIKGVFAMGSSLCQGLGDLDEKGNVTEADQMNSPCKEVPLAFTGHFSFR